MPTGARLVAAIVFAIFAYILAQFVHVALEADAGFEISVGAMPYILTAVGALCGWIIMGKRVGDGVKFAMSSGLLTAVAIGFWGLLIFSGYEMIICRQK